MPVSIRGDKNHIQIQLNGRPLLIQEFVDFSFREESQLSDTYYIGRKEPEVDKNQMGWSGSFTMEVKHAILDEVVQEINDAKKAGSASPDVRIVVLEEYGIAGDRKSYVFDRCELIYENRRSAGIQEKITKTFSFKAQNMRVE